MQSFSPVRFWPWTQIQLPGWQLGRPPQNIRPKILRRLKFLAKDMREGRTCYMLMVVVLCVRLCIWHDCHLLYAHAEEIFMIAVNKDNYD